MHLVKCILIFFSFIMNHRVFWVFSVERKGVLMDWRLQDTFLVLLGGSDV